MEKLGLSFALLLWILPATGAPLPDLGRSDGWTLSPAEEARLGRQFFRQLQRHHRLVEDLEIQDYIATLGQRLAGKVRTEAPFHFFVIDDPQINAFAGPAGYIGIDSGLILLTEDESELASVIAHEIAHVSRRHLQRNLAEARRLSLPLLAAALAAAVAASHNPKLGQAALIALQAGGMQHRINFGRKQEEEADAVGLQLLGEAGFDPEGMSRLFQRIVHLAKLSPHPPPFLQTHPIAAERFVRAYLTGRGHRPVPSTLRYELMRAKLRFLTQTAEEAEQAFEGDRMHPDSRRQTAARYGLALLAKARGRPEEAARELLQLSRKYPYEISLLHALGQVEFLQDRERALDRYRRLLDLFPDHRLLQLLYGEMLLRAGRYGQAYRFLERWVDLAEDWPFLYRWLAQAASGMGKGSLGDYYFSRYLYARGELKRAIALLKTALGGNLPNRKEAKRLLARWQGELQENGRLFR